MSNRIAKYNLWVQIGIFITSLGTFIVLVCALCVAKNTLNESAKMNKMSYGGQLYANEQRWIERCATMKHGFSIFARLPIEMEPKVYIEKSLSLVPKIKRTNFSSVQELYEYTWGIDKFYASGKNELRHLYDLAETILYHIHTVYDYSKGGLIYEDEYKSYAAILNDIGPHPLLLASIYNGHESKYISKQFGKELQRIMVNENPRARVIRELYPSMCKDDWTDTLFDY